MAIRSSSYYERQAEEAKKRETFLRTRPPRPAGTTVSQRGATTEGLYRSMLIKQGTNPAIFSVDVLTLSLTAVGGLDDCGLLSAMPTAAAGATAQNTPLRVRGSGMKPTRVHWYKGNTPTVQTSRWGTNWTKYYAPKSHQSVPISDAVGASVTVSDVQARFDLIFKDPGRKVELLGAKNGRAYLEFERVSYSSRT